MLLPGICFMERFAINWWFSLIFGLVGGFLLSDHGVFFPTIGLLCENSTNQINQGYLLGSEKPREKSSVSS